MSFVVAVISLGVARVSSLESRRQREDYLNRRFEDRNWSLEQFVARFDTISVEENDGTRYKIHKFVFGDLEGTALVSVHTNVQIEDVWTNEEYTEIFDEFTENEVEVVQHEMIKPNYIQIVFRVGTVDYDAISETVFKFLVYLKTLTENGALVQSNYYRLQSDSNSQFP